MIFGWFNTKELDEFADSIVQRIMETYPAPGGAVSGKKAFERLRRQFSGTFERIDSFARAHRPNLYQKARFANRVRWALREAGYPADFVKTVTDELVTHVTLAARAK